MLRPKEFVSLSRLHEENIAESAVLGSEFIGTFYIVLTQASLETGPKGHRSGTLDRSHPDFRVDLTLAHRLMEFGFDRSLEAIFELELHYKSQIVQCIESIVLVHFWPSLSLTPRLMQDQGGISELPADSKA